MAKNKYHVAYPPSGIRNGNRNSSQLGKLEKKIINCAKVRFFKGVFKGVDIGFFFLK